jgi:hypothetical protein
VTRGQCQSCLGSLVTCESRRFCFRHFGETVYFCKVWNTERESTLMSYECRSVTRSFRSVYVRYFAVVDFVWAKDFWGVYKLFSQNIRDCSQNSFQMWITIPISRSVRYDGLLWRLCRHAYSAICLLAPVHLTCSSCLRWSLLYIFHVGTVVAQWLRCCATNRKIACSILDGVIGILHWHLSDRSMGLWLTEPPTEISTMWNSWG